MHPIQQFLNKARTRILSQRLGFLLSLLVLLVAAWGLLYGLALLVIHRLSLTWVGGLAVPALGCLAFAIAVPVYWWRLRRPRVVARILEQRLPELQFKLRSALDFLEGKSDPGGASFQELFLDQVTKRLPAIDLQQPSRLPWGRLALVAALLCLCFWIGFRDKLLLKFYNPAVSIGQTHLDIREGSLTLFEPEYTQIPGRTLPLKPGTFNAYPGARVRFQIQVPVGVTEIYIAREGKAERPTAVPIRDGSAVHELLLTENQAVRFLLSESDNSGRTEPYVFELKTDTAPELQFRSYTPEGPIKELDPLLFELEVKDDFGVKSFEAVVTTEGKEERLPLKIPPTRRSHFVSRNQWFLSDLKLGEATSFSIYFEAKDASPAPGPGVGKSATLTYELESPDKKYQEFMELAKQLLDTMTHTLGDNLETVLGTRLDPNELIRAEATGRSISSGLFQSLSLSNDLLGRIRETPNLTQLDQNFLYQFRNNLSNQAQTRVQLNQFFGSIQSGQGRVVYSDLLRGHRSEEVGVETLTYDLVVQLKMWAMFEMERHKNELDADMKEMEALLEKADEMESEELMKLFDQMMNQVMKDFEKMMTAAAEQMNMEPQEFMNQEAMQDQSDQLAELRKQIMEALKKGDLEKAKKLMEEMRAQMEAAAQSMQQSVGEMSPEMQAMMANMRELMGLLRELKSGEEGLEKSTRDLKSEYDKKLGANQAQLDQAKRQELSKATEHIHQLLESLYNKLVEYKNEDLSSELLRQINQRKEQLAQNKLSPDEAQRLADEIDANEQLLDMLTREGLSALQEETLKSLQQTEQLQKYLDQGEMNMAFDSGLKLDNTFDNAKRIAERTTSPKVQQEAKPVETYEETRTELQKILQALYDGKNKQDIERSQQMREQNEQRQQELAQKQDQLQKMIQEFMKKTEGSIGESQVGEKLEEIGRSMQNAQDGLRESLLEAGIQSQQDALQKIGEMMEQLQQSSQPNGARPSSMPMGRRDGFQGDPSLEDIFIPESEKQAVRDQLKESIRERMNRNLPDAYGKEIKKYYEKLMDQ